MAGAEHLRFQSVKAELKSGLSLPVWLKVRPLSGKQARASAKKAYKSLSGLLSNYRFQISVNEEITPYACKDSLSLGSLAVPASDVPGFDLPFVERSD
jgi:hypothetical protein